jgi:hypothetical protein
VVATFRRRVPRDALSSDPHGACGARVKKFLLRPSCWSTTDAMSHHRRSLSLATIWLILRFV